jgi:lipopolysaccharide export system protein LptA
MIRALAPLAAVLLFPLPAASQLIANSNEPIDITGDSLELVEDVATWKGNVRAIQGEAIMTADELVATLGADGGFKSLQAVGAVRYSNGKEAITGKTAVYDAVARSITISENVVITQGKTVMTGGALIYWVDSGRIRFTAPGGARIRGIFHTNSLDTKL